MHREPQKEGKSRTVKLDSREGFVDHERFRQSAGTAGSNNLPYQKIINSCYYFHFFKNGILKKKEREGGMREDNEQPRSRCVTVLFTLKASASARASPGPILLSAKSGNLLNNTKITIKR